jgi:hypothetical protein
LLAFELTKVVVEQKEIAQQEKGNRKQEQDNFYLHEQQNGDQNEDNPITALETLFFRFAWMTGDEASIN